MKKLKMTLILASYLIILKIVHAIAIPVRFFQWGLLFDALFLTLFFTLFVYFIRSLLWQKIIYIISVIFWTILTIADTIYYTYFFTLGARSNLQGLTQVSPDLMTEEYAISLPLGMIPVILLGIVVIVLIMLQKEADRVPKNTLYFSGYLAIVHVVLLLSFFLPTPSQTLAYYQSDAYLYRAMPNRVRFAEKFGYYYYHTVDLVRPTPRIDLETARSSIDAFFNNQAPHQENAFTGQLEGHNVVKITVESLDTRFIDPVISPTLYQMLNNGYHFDNIYVPVFQQGATCNSEFIATIGLYAVNSNDYMNNICAAYNTNAFPYSMPNQLKDAGYSTYYFHSGYELFYQRKYMIPQYGFETVRFIEDLYALGYTDYNERLDTEMMHFIDEFMVFEEPFYLQLLTYGLHGAYTHEDYLHHDPIINQVYDDELDSEIRVYLQKLYEFDLFLEGLVERLKEEGVYDNTLFVIYTDHYPYMLNQETLGDFLSIDETSEELFRQSLIVYNSNLQSHTFSQIGATIDIVPTVLNLVYPDADFSYFFGNDLFNVEDGYAFLHDLSIVDSTGRYFLHNNAISNPQLQEALEIEMIKYNLQIKLLEIDYFNLSND